MSGRSRELALRGNSEWSAFELLVGKTWNLGRFEDFGKMDEGHEPKEMKTK